MARNQDDIDPYAPPPRYKNRSGAVMRFIVLAALLGAAAWGYVEFSNQQQTASLTPPVQDQRVADAGYRATPIPEATPAPSAQTSSPAPAPTTRATPAQNSTPQPPPAPAPSSDATPG